jgi:hypothetical protein
MECFPFFTPHHHITTGLLVGQISGKYHKAYFKAKKHRLKRQSKPALVAYVCNPSYLGTFLGCSKTAQADSSQDYIFKITTAKWTLSWRVSDLQA